LATIGVRAINNNPAPRIREYPENASAGSFVYGDLVVISAGTVKIASSDQALSGVALKAATGVSATSIPIMVLDSNTEYVMQADTTTTAGMEHVDYGLNIGTAGSMSVDIGDTTTVSVVCQKLDPRDGAAATGRMIVKFKSAVLTGEAGL